MSKLTSEEWIKITNRFTELNKSKELSSGKSYFQALEEIKPKLFSKLKGTKYDCSESEHNLVPLLYYLNGGDEKDK